MSTLDPSSIKEEASADEESEKDDFPPSKIFNCNYPDVEDQPEYFFETDHDALRGNQDYLTLLKTMSILQAQKIKAVNDFEVLLEARDEALKDPLVFVGKLERGEQLNLPGCQKLVEMPNINWDKYNLPSLHHKKPETRLSRTNSNVDLNDDTDVGGQFEAVAGVPGAKVERNLYGQYLVRGRLFDPNNKPRTFNQPWTPEEQRRLEQLLVEYPSEDVEMERWKKIANALGNRTAIQVQSRVQKYFLKLQKAGLPVPGKLSKNSKVFRSAYGFSRSAKNSSFFPDLKPCVKMSDADEMSADMIDPFTGDNFSHLWPTPGSSNSTTAGLNDGFYFEMEDVSDEEGVSDKDKQSPEYNELLWLKRIRREKEFQLREGGQQTHTGFKCDGCQMEPIRGGRFSCIDCMRADLSVDFCLECAPKNVEVPEVDHNKSHTLKAARKKICYNPGIDRDYVVSEGNYLDPNFM